MTREDALTLCAGTFWDAPGGPTTKRTSAMSSLLNIKAFLKRTKRNTRFRLWTHKSVYDSKSQPNAPLPLSQRRVSGLPAGSLDVIIVDVLLSGSCSRRCHRLSDLDDGLFAGSCNCCAITVRKVGIYAGRIEFCSHLLP